MVEEFDPYEYKSPAEERKSRIERELVYITEEEPSAEEQSAPSEEPIEEDESFEQPAPTSEEIAEAEAEAAREERRRAREANPFWQFISGNWLILDGITGTYRYLLIVAAALFLSVVSIFYTFHLSEKYTLRASEVQLLRERSLEYSRIRFNKTSHTAIIRELERRNISLYDIQESKTIIE